MLDSTMWLSLANEMLVNVTLAEAWKNTAHFALLILALPLPDTKILPF